MHKWLSLSSVLLLAAVAGAQNIEPPHSNGSLQTTPLYSPSKDGFRAQLDAIIQYYRSGDTTTGRHSIDNLRLPHAEEWFTEHLGPEQNRKLTERYDRLFANFEESLEKTIEDVVANKGADLVTDLEEGNGESPSDVRRPGAKLSGVVSVKKPDLFYGKFRIIVRKKDATSWADTFVHEDGEFRFLGFGAWPFWVWEDGTEGRAPKGGSFSQPPILITQVPPVYPVPARASRVEGVVVVRVLLDKEGHVKKADIINGDPLLAQAAIDAVRQWRFKPSTLGGAPVEAELTVDVNFKLN